MSCRSLATAALLGALAAGCAVSPEWREDLVEVLSETRRKGQELVVFFALPERDASDRMQATLDDPVVLRALADGGFAAVVVDGIERKRLYSEWVGGGEGMGIAVLDGNGDCYAARPGPQDPPQLAAMIRRCAAARDELATLRAQHEQDPLAPLPAHELGCLYLWLGCRVRCEPLLVTAAMAGVADARHRLARYYALDGNLGPARRWLATAPKTPASLATEGYVLFKERRHKEAVEVFDRALGQGLEGEERQRAVLYLGKSLHEAQDDGRAVHVLEKLAAEGTGSVFEAGARHTLNHIYNPDDGHTH